MEFCKRGVFAVALVLLQAVSLFAVPELRALPEVCSVSDTLSLWVMDQDVNTGNSLQKLTRKFTRQSGIPVKIRFLDWGTAFEELNKSLKIGAYKSKGYPDVLQLGSSWVPYFAREGLIAPITDVAASLDTNRFFSEALKASRIGRDTVVYSLPWFLDVRGFFANERMWLELGLHESEMNTYPKFFGMLRAVAKAEYANKAGVQVEPFEFGVKNDWTGYQQMAPILWNFGGDFVAEWSGGYRSALADSLTLEGLRHYFKFLRDVDVAPYNLHENSSQAADRFVRAEQLMIFGTSELIRKMEFENEMGGLKDSPLASDGLIAISSVEGPAGNFTFVGGSHLALPKAADSVKQQLAKELFMFMLRADNVDYYSRHSGFIPSDRGLIRIWMQDSRYNHLIDELEHNARSCPNIPEWSELELLINGMVTQVAATLANRESLNNDVNDEIARLVFETHRKMNDLLGYKGNDDGAQDRIKSILMQPVVEEKYAKEIGSAEKSELNLRLVLFAALGFVAVILLLLSCVKNRKR